MKNRFTQNKKPSVQTILKIIRDHAKQSDQKGKDACMRSKFSIADYYLCVEFNFQQLHDHIAKALDLSIRCPKYPFRKAIDKFRKQQSRT